MCEGNETNLSRLILGVPATSAKNKCLSVLSFSSTSFEVRKKKMWLRIDGFLSQLIPLLPMEISEIVVKEPPERGDNYPHIKKSALSPVPTHACGP
ncbi:hypothetical protein TNCT_238431 [Trichonephila clavata]|uniref:Uncharacterized protein n=1 Tax=Trichonephila clavata TaxID=2740835 RepID=A0A8X6GDV5_TRICU|nr:hypothetical protein TNCT_238421 [Trichonephila clavata]GFR01911.1 hypothetical protein TNCT_238431 [Trichonephila clavata]